MKDNTVTMRRVHFSVEHSKEAKRERERLFLSSIIAILKEMKAVWNGANRVELQWPA